MDGAKWFRVAMLAICFMMLCFTGATTYLQWQQGQKPPTASDVAMRIFEETLERERREDHERLLRVIAIDNQRADAQDRVNRLILKRLGIEVK